MFIHCQYFSLLFLIGCAAYLFLNVKLIKISALKWISKFWNMDAKIKSSIIIVAKSLSMPAVSNWCVVLKFQGGRKRAFINFHFYWEKSKAMWLSIMRFSYERTGIVTSWNWYHDIIDMEGFILHHRQWTCSSWAERCNVSVVSISISRQLFFRSSATRVWALTCSLLLFDLSYFPNFALALMSALTWLVSEYLGKRKCS